MQQYLNVVREVLSKGTPKSDRTGTGTISYFGISQRYDLLNDGFPIVTTKKMAIKSIIAELFWFMRGETNFINLKRTNVRIWDKDGYSYYTRQYEKSTKTEGYRGGNVRTLTEFMKVVNEFVNISKLDGIADIKDFTDRLFDGGEYSYILGDLGDIYGKQWRGDENDGDRDRFDQLANAVKMLIENPYSRRIIVDSWNVSQLHNMALPPCHCFFQFNARLATKEEKLQHIKNVKEIYGNDMDITHLDGVNVVDLSLTQRSGDVGLGVPFNISSYAVLLQIISDITGNIAGTFIHNINDCHIYNDHIEPLETQLIRNPLPLPKLRINYPHTVESLDFTNRNDFDFLLNEMGDEEIEIVGYKSHDIIKMNQSF